MVLDRSRGRATPGPDGLLAMTQRVADVFAQRIAERPQDWQLLQPFFGPSGAGS